MSSDQDQSARFAVIVFVAIRMAVVIVIVMVMGVIARRGTALTGRLGRHSTAGLTVVAAAILPFPQLDEIVGHNHAQLRGERRVIGGPIRQGGCEAGLWSRVRFGHADEFRLLTGAPRSQLAPVPTRVATTR